MFRTIGTTTIVTTILTATAAPFQTRKNLLAVAVRAAGKGWKNEDLHGLQARGSGTGDCERAGMNRVSEDWIRDEIDNCPPDDGGWQAKINSALSELLRARRVIETLTFHAGDKDRQCWCGTCTSLREYKAKYPNEAVERAQRLRAGMVLVETTYDDRTEVRQQPWPEHSQAHRNIDRVTRRASVEPPARPSFAEALQEEALLGGDTTMTWSDFVDCVKRARRASEG